MCFISEIFNWDNAEKSRGINDEIEGDFLETSFDRDEWKDDPCYFVVKLIDSSSNDAYILFYRDKMDIYDYKLAFIINSDVGVDTAKKILKNTIKYIE